MIDYNTNMKLRRLYNPEGSDLRIAQKEMLNMLVIFDKICRENNLEYWLSFGTLLGAIRHGGFIPWDDDTDVCMPYEDAMKLKNIMGNNIIEQKIVLQTHDTDPHYINLSWMTIRNINSEYIQNSDLHNSLKYKGLQIDVFIMEKGVSPFLKRLSTSYLYRLIWNPWLNKKYKILRPLTNLFYLFFDKLLSPIFKTIKFNKKLNTGYGCPFNLEVSPNIIYPLRDIEFEGHKFYCPNKYQAYLSSYYGEWEKIPSKENIKTHHVKFKFL